MSLLFITPGCKQAKGTVNEYNIVPLPNKIIPQEGRFDLSSKVQVISNGGTLRNGIDYMKDNHQDVIQVNAHPLLCLSNTYLGL